MASLFKEKKGVEGSALVVGIVLTLISAGVILWLVYGSASKANDKVTIDICRISNEIRVGTEDYSHWFLPLHSPRICDTIYKTEPKLQIPDPKKYPQNEKGAEDEIGDMLKNCWYMWLEGSDPKVFPKSGPFYWFGGKGCHVCYVFKVKNVLSFNFDDIMKSLSQRTYSAKDSSDGCAPNNGGGFLRGSCNADEKVIPSRLADSQHKKCCIKKDDLDECGNKGGECAESPPGPTSHIYDKWLCTEPEQQCYVKEENYYSYLRYLTEFGKRGGFVNEPSDAMDKFTISGANAISIYSGDSNDVGDVFLRISSLDYATGDGHCAIS